MADILESQEDSLLDNEALEVGLNQDNKQEDGDLPEKFKGKDAKAIADAYTNLEELYGKQTREIGDLRKLADDFLREKLSEKQVKPVEDQSDIDFFTDPKKAINHAVENHPTVLEAQKGLQAVKQLQAMNALKEAHSDYPNVVSDPGFREWVQKSKVRTTLFMQADKAFDSDAAIELIDLWKELNKAQKTEEIKQTQEAKRKESLGKAAVSSGTGGESSKKVFRRADLIKLKMTDPDKYRSLENEIMRAYQEGRVK